jgi:predicted nuclease with RNAse H fold
MESEMVFAGIDLSTSRRGLTVALLTSRLDVRSLRLQSLEETIEELATRAEITVAVGGPLHPCAVNAEQVPPVGDAPRKSLARRTRAADGELSRRGIPVRRPPVRESDAPAWMRCGFDLARQLAARGFTEGKNACAEPRVLLETHPAACASVLLGRLPYGRGSLEGRIQRQLVLLRERVGLPDPMDALEELTAHHILSGRMELKGIFEAGELDALLAALTAWRVHAHPESVAWLGDDADGWICLPGNLLDNYKKYTDDTEKPRITPNIP